MRWSRLASFGIPLLCACPALLALGYVRSFGVNVPFWDQWDFVRLLHREATGSLTVSELFAQNSEHRIFFPRLLMLALAHVSRFDTKAEMYASWLVVVLTAAVLFFELREEGDTAARWWMRFAPVPWLLFSLRQYENFLWGFQLQIFLCILAVVTGAACLRRSLSRPRWTVPAMAAGVIATYTSAAGALYWVAGLAALLLAPARRARRVPITAFGVAGAVSTALYYVGYTKPAYNPSLAAATEHPGSALWFWLAANGNVTSVKTGVAAAAGALIFALGCMALIQMLRGAGGASFAGSCSFCCMFLFAMGTSAVITLGRFGLGMPFATESRYVTFGMLGAIATYALLLHSGGPREKTWGLGAVVPLFMLTVFSSFDGTYEIGESWLRSRQDSVAVLRDYRARPDADLKLLFSEPEMVRSGAQFLEADHLSIFSAPSRQ